MVEMLIRVEALEGVVSTVLEQVKTEGSTTRSRVLQRSSASRTTGLDWSLGLGRVLPEGTETLSKHNKLESLGEGRFSESSLWIWSPKH
jgi:2-polyprenyl-3-methyl-5-hydroxy-6-metoxy-1,4-benzoquinol methylase